MGKHSSKQQGPAWLTPFPTMEFAWLGWLIVGLLGLWVVFLAPLSKPITHPSWNEPALLVVIAWLTTFILSSVAAVLVSRRCARVLLCRWDPAREERLVTDLASPSLAKVRWALLTLLDLRGWAFGEVNPFRCDETQLRMLVGLYRVWWERADETAPLDAFAQRARAIRDRLVPLYQELMRDQPEAEDAARDPALERLPPVSVRWLVERMQSRFEGSLTVLADKINHAGNRGDVLACEKQAQELFAALAAQAVEEAWRARFDAAEQRQAGSEPTREGKQP